MNGICNFVQVSAYKPTYMKHRVFVRTEPVIKTRPAKEIVLQVE